MEGIYEMGITKTYVDQIVVMNTREQGREIRSLAEKWGVSIAEISRVAQGYGLGSIDKHYEKAGRAPARALKASRAARARSIPKAEFTAPK